MSFWEWLMSLFGGGGTETPATFPPPTKPSGPTELRIGVKGKWKTKDKYDPLDAHEFWWEWGDGTHTEWDDDGESAKHAYTKAGTFFITAETRCPMRLFQSGPSAALKVVVN